jgi:hypothetical protein
MFCNLLYLLFTVHFSERFNNENKLYIQVVNKYGQVVNLLTICNNLVDSIRLVARLFQQIRYSHDITILLQPCIVNLVTLLLYHDCIRLVRTAL